MPRSIGSSQSARGTMAAGTTTLVKNFNLSYLFEGRGRHKRPYRYYRRNGKYIPITSPDGRRLQPGDAGFLEAYERIHASFGVELGPPKPIIGTLAHLIDTYRAAPEFLTLAPK